MKLAPILRVLLVLAASSAPARAQHVFHPERDLPGFEASGLSEYADLYEHDSFQALDGKELSDDELAAVRQRWNAEKERVHKRIGVLESDAGERWVWLLEKRLARSSSLGRLGLLLRRPAPGIVLALEPPRTNAAEWEKRVTEAYLPFVARLEKNFVELLARPAGLERRKEQPLTALALFASRDDYEGLLAEVRDPGDDAGRTAYDYALQLVLACDDPAENDVPLAARRASVLYQVAKGLQHAWLGQPGNRPGSIWLYQGLAYLFAAHDEPRPEALDVRAPRREVVEDLVAILQDPSERSLLLFPVDELAALGSAKDFVERIEARATAQQVARPPDGRIARAFVAQCALWAHFLFDGAQGAYRKPYLEFVRAAFRGRGGAEELRAAFVAFDPREFSHDFLRWACDLYDRQHPGRSAERVAIGELFPAPPRAAGEPNAVPLVPKSFAPAMLAPGADDFDALSAHALLLAREGELERALEVLSALSATADAGWGPRIARDLERVTELRKMRDAVLAWLVSSGEVLVIRWKNHDLPVTIEAVEKDRVRLKSNELGLPAVPLEAIDPAHAARVASRPEALGAAQPWSRAFAALLAGEPRWDRTLQNDMPGAAELRADAKACAERMRTGAVARELFELSKLPLPRDSKQAAPLLERVRALLVSGAGTGLLVRRMDALRQLALAALGARAAEQGLASLLRGKWTPTADGGGKLVYEFDDPAEEQDWQRVPDYKKPEREALGKLAIDDAHSKLAVSKGAWRGSGSTTYRLALDFSGPVTRRYAFRFVEVKGSFATPYFAWHLCDDGEGSDYRSPPNGEIFVEDTAHLDVRAMQIADKPAFDWNKDWNIEFAYDGRKLATKLQGKPRTSIEAGKLDHGGIVLVVHSPLGIVFQRVEIEGRIDPSSLDRLRAAWAANELRALGFP